MIGSRQLHCKILAYLSRVLVRHSLESGDRYDRFHLTLHNLFEFNCFLKFLFLLQKKLDSTYQIWRSMLVTLYLQETNPYPPPILTMHTVHTCIAKEPEHIFSDTWKKFQCETKRTFTAGTWQRLIASAKWSRASFSQKARCNAVTVCKWTWDQASRWCIPKNRQRCVRTSVNRRT